tara:strand:+ start:717 stop:1364 length:648 start_codon:yes stop_codon:yes gene_type:complete
MSRRKPRSRKTITRAAPSREPYKKVLIVCEGEKTEPQYFENLIDHWELSSANVLVVGDCGSDPISIVKCAKKKFNQSKKIGDPFDNVFCVFDKDSHVNYKDALAMVKNASPTTTFESINSVPCFEYWLLLHFFYTTRPFVGSGNKSAGQEVLAELKPYFPEYQKGSREIYSQLIGRLTDAKTNADKSRKAAARDGTDNPSTRVDKLVNYLENLKN